MSTIYNLEPQPTGSAVIHTTLGEIAIELFAKQTPLTCRNFLQLALDGYYDNTIFHRLVPNFILQGGDPTGTGNGGESIYDGGAFGGDLDPWPLDQRRGQNAGPTGINFKDEFHSRLKFNRRGLLGMANESRLDSNGSQFFFTLDKTEELNGKNTLFGRVAGDTIYNLAKIGESEVEEGSDRPLYPIKVLKVEILVNPFEDMVKRSRTATVVQTKAPVAKDKKKKRKGGKQLLSFGDEEGDEELPILKKAKFDTRIVMAAEEEEPAAKATGKKKKVKDSRPPDAAVAKAEQVADTSDDKDIAKPGEKTQRKEVQDDDSLMETSPPPAPKKSALEQANEELAALKATMRRNLQPEKPAAQKEKSALEAMIPENSTRGRKRRPGGVNTTALEDQKALGFLKAFQARLDEAPPSKEIAPKAEKENAEQPGGAVGDDEAELCDLHFIANCQSCTAWDKEQEAASDDEGWMSHALSFAADKLGKDLSNRRKAEEELVVIDPREKAKALKDNRRSEREGQKGSGRAWDQARDQARNAQLARATSLAGRGAK